MNFTNRGACYLGCVWWKFMPWTLRQIYIGNMTLLFQYIDSWHWWHVGKRWQCDKLFHTESGTSVHLTSITSPVWLPSQCIWPGLTDNISGYQRHQILIGLNKHFSLKFNGRSEQKNQTSQRPKKKMQCTFYVIGEFWPTHGVHSHSTL